MDNGYMVGPREVIFGVLEDLAKGISEGTCEMATRKSKMFSLGEDTWENRNKRGCCPLVLVPVFCCGNVFVRCIEY